MLRILKARLDLRRAETSGFTLIELLIVMVILGILATIVLFATGQFTTDSKQSAKCANAKIANIAEAAYAAQHNGTDAGSDTTKLAPYMQDGWPADNAPTYSGTKWVCT